MRLLMVHGSGQNELTYHYQTARFPDADAVNLPGHPDGEPRDSIGGYVNARAALRWQPAPIIASPEIT